MGVVTVSSSASRSPVGFGASWSLKQQIRIRRPVILAFKTDGKRKSGFLTAQEPVAIPVDAAKEPRNISKRSEKKSKKPVKAVAVDEAPSCSTELDCNAFAATLESIYKDSPDDDHLYELEEESSRSKRARPTSKKAGLGKKNEDDDQMAAGTVVRSTRKKPARMSLNKRIELTSAKGKVMVNPKMRRKTDAKVVGDVDILLRDYSESDNMEGLDWKILKIPEVLPSKEHTWLFKLMQPMQAMKEAKESITKDPSREPTEKELADAMKMTVFEMKRQVKIGQAARNKLVKHNLRLVLFVMNKYFAYLGNTSMFDDLCQAGVNGLIMAIDRFEAKRGFRLSTYGFFWIRHAIIRAITLSNVTRLPFSIETVRQQVQKAKFHLTLELNRPPTHEEIIASAGISAAKYRSLLKASQQTLSLNARHAVTQEEYINAISDEDAVGGDKRRQEALLRLALDDVLDSLKPKESMVIRQRFGLDGKGNRSLGEIAGNLSISREMVRKYELKALMKLRHPARVDYLKKHMS